MIDLRWDQVDLKRRLLHVRRLKNGTSSNHPLGKKECRCLQRLRECHPEARFVFVSERKRPLTTVRKMTARAGRYAQLPFPSIPTCCATRVAINLRTMAMIRVRSSTISATGPSRIQYATQNCRPIDSADSGNIEGLLESVLTRRSPTRLLGRDSGHFGQSPKVSMPLPPEYGGCGGTRRLPGTTPLPRALFRWIRGARQIRDPSSCPVPKHPCADPPPREIERRF